jgi:uncharacterized protein GlcG (DUF336 family)
MKKSIMAVMASAVLIGGIPMGAVADEAAPTVSLKRLSLQSANKIAMGAIEACRKKGIQIGVTVVDRDGTVQAVMRDTIAARITVPISRMKAFTAANFNAATSGLSDRASPAIGNIDGLVFSAGGLPVQAAGHLLGAVGVSGAPDGKVDEECAQAGIDSIIDDLEMEM